MTNEERFKLLSDINETLEKLGTDNLELIKEFSDILYESERNNLPF